MFCSEIMAVCSETHTVHTNKFCPQNLELFNVTTW
jgi:hypothetical protein